MRDEASKASGATMNVNLYLDDDIQVHSLTILTPQMISSPQPGKSVALRVAKNAPRDAAIAAICASACEIGWPVRRRLAAMRAQVAAA